MKVKLNLGLLIAMSSGLLILAGCAGGSATGGSCSVDQDCENGLEICVDSTCQSLSCSSDGDCPHGICNPATGKCTWKCVSDADCKDGAKCLDTGICGTQVVNPDVTANDTMEDANTGSDTQVDTSKPPVKTDDCKECKSDKDCADGYKCMSLSTGKSCLRSCENNGDCLSGYICYAVSTEGKNCVPPSYKCVDCASKGCPQGKVCDLSAGQCKDQVAVCGPCMLDWECGIGFRCYHKDMNSKGVCMPECKDVSDCPQPQDKYTCAADSQGAKMCQPQDSGVCCPADKPHMLEDGTCVQCANAQDCNNGEVCDPTTHTCQTGGCPTGQKLCSDDNQCHQCCEVADCPADNNCTNHVCVPKNDPCQGACTDPNFPYCVNYQGNWTCAACDPNNPSSCSSPCVCDPNSFTCLMSDGTVCGGGGPQGGTCSSDQDCVDQSGSGKTLKCSSKGFCYDPSGSCDNQSAFCDASSGSTCADLMSLLFGGMGGMPGLPQGGTMMGVCTCDNGAQCPDGVTCFPLSVLCAMPLIGQMICPGGQLPPNAPQNVCKDPSTLLGGL